MNVPAFIPCFNNPTYARRMVGQLVAQGFKEIILVDGGSSYPPMLCYLSFVESRQRCPTCPVRLRVVRFAGNRGPWQIFLDDRSYAALPQLFVITDPDLQFNPQLPCDFVRQLVELTERHRIGKAGFALDISDHAAMRQEKVSLGSASGAIWEMESGYWRDQVETLAGGDVVYRAAVDTTFAVYNKQYFYRNHWGSDHAHNNLNAVRVAGRFTARHLSWYRESIVPQEEREFYRGASRFSHLPGHEACKI